MPIMPEYQEKRHYWIYFLIATLLLLWEHAWLSEDMLISYRVVDNFHHGFGLRWNIDERVEVFTHPLWMLMHLALRYVIDNMFIISLLLSTVFTLLAMRYIAKTRPELNVMTWFIWAVMPLFWSSSVWDYTISSLENPLAFFCISCFYYRLVQDAKEGEISWFILSLICSAALLTRLDLALLFAPVMVYLFLRKGWSVQAWLRCFLGLLPFVVWKAFALLYYGFLLPNTYYAKLSSQLDLGWYMQQGMYYLKDLILGDLVGYVLMLVGVVLVIYKILAREGAITLRLFQMTLLFYIGYVFYIGGGYMAGRFWAVPIFMSVMIIYHHFAGRTKTATPLMVALVGCFALSSWMRDKVPGEVVNGNVIYHNVTDQREVLKDGAALVNWQRRKLDWYPIYNLVYQLNKLALLDLQKQMIVVNFTPQAQTARDEYINKYLLIGAIGATGLVEGAKMTLIDVFGIADPIIARLPIVAVSGEGIRIGHFQRPITKSFVHYRMTRQKHVLHPDLQEFVAPVELIMQGDLWLPERLQAIMDINLGKFDAALERYAQELLKYTVAAEQ